MHYTIDGETYLAVANADPVDSKIYKWNSTAFVEIQAISTKTTSTYSIIVIYAALRTDDAHIKNRRAIRAEIS